MEYTHYRLNKNQERAQANTIVDSGLGFLFPLAAIRMVAGRGRAFRPRELLLQSTMSMAQGSRSQQVLFFHLSVPSAELCLFVPLV